MGADAYRLGLGVLQWPIRALGAAAASGAVGGPSPVTFVADPTDIVVVPVLLVPLALALARGSTTGPASVSLPAATERVDGFSLAVAVLAALLLLGAVVDGWAHTHVASSLETVLTPWHGLLYATSAALVALLGSWALAHWDGGGPLRRAIPAGHGSPIAGRWRLGLAGAWYTLWHLVFGILEADAAAPREARRTSHWALGPGWWRWDRCERRCCGARWRRPRDSAHGAGAGRRDRASSRSRPTSRTRCSIRGRCSRSHRSHRCGRSRHWASGPRAAVGGGRRRDVASSGCGRGPHPARSR